MRTVGAPPTARPRAVIERTSPTDLMQLACEVTGSPMQVAAVLVLGAATAVDLTAVRDAIGRRLSSVPRLRQRLVRAPLGPGDPSGSTTRTSTSAGTSTPSNAPLQAMRPPCSTSSPTLSPTRCRSTERCGRATLVTDMADGRAALIVMLHHVLADGIGGLAVLARLVDGAPTASKPEFPGHHRAAALSSSTRPARGCGRSPTSRPEPDDSAAPSPNSRRAQLPDHRGPR